MDTFLSRDDTKILKAIAVIWMLLHHMWGFAERIFPEGEGWSHLFYIFDSSSLSYLGHFGKICVSIFFFLGGYGIYISSYGKQYDLIGKLKKLYFAYWKVFLIFVPIAFLFFRNQGIYSQVPEVCTKYDYFVGKLFPLNFTGISSDYNPEWWFLFEYAVAVSTFPLIRSVIDKNPARINIFLVIVASIFVTSVFPAISKLDTPIGQISSNHLLSWFFCPEAPYISCFWMGAVMARNGLLTRLNEAMSAQKLLNPFTDILIQVIIIYTRNMMTDVSMDFVYVPMLVITYMDLVNRIKPLRSMLIGMGKQSTNMWLIHSFFCYYFGIFVIFIRSIKWAVPALIVLIVMSYAAGLLVDLFWNTVGKGYRRLTRRQNNPA